MYARIWSSACTYGSEPAGRSGRRRVLLLLLDRRAVLVRLGRGAEGLELLELALLTFVEARRHRDPAGRC
jgi:hypothetical protein